MLSRYRAIWSAFGYSSNFIYIMWAISRTNISSGPGRYLHYVAMWNVIYRAYMMINLVLVQHFIHDRKVMLQYSLVNNNPWGQKRVVYWTYMMINLVLVQHFTHDRKVISKCSLVKKKKRLFISTLNKH